MKVRDLIKKLEADGWYVVRTKGGHSHFQHPTKRETVTVSGIGNPGKDVPEGTLAAILKAAGLPRQQ